MIMEEKGKSRLRWVGVLVAFCLWLIAAGIGAQGEKPADKSKERPDVLMIDTLKAFGDLEKPRVVFLHDLHTDALEKKGKDCSACHLKEDKSGKIPGAENLEDAVKGIDKLSPKFKRLKDTARQDVMDVYHKFCMECHTDMSSAGDKAGPVTCGGCHQKNPVKSSRQEMGLDKSLHFRHVKAQDKKCEKCHHEYNEKEKKLVYVKEKEADCRFCHKKETEEKRISMRLASHIACVDCHRQILAKKNPDEKAGPVKCAGCHDLIKQKAIEKVAEVPRLERKQPDTVLVKTSVTEVDSKTYKMPPVAYDHKAHEGYNDTCRVCHHASMDACSKCHTLSGGKDGQFVNLEKSMHLASSNKACIGCHIKKQETQKCAGCHTFISKTKMKQDSCKACHVKVPGEPEITPKTDTAPMAKAVLDARQANITTYPDEDIPEKVVIKNLVNKYEAAEFPHRKVVQTLVKNISENKLAGYFHTDQGMICQGCHHNSPISKKPPKCANCHGKPFDEKSPYAPGMTGAYHQQCMGCHEAMGLKKPAGCTGCHKER